MILKKGIKILYLHDDSAKLNIPISAKNDAYNRFIISDETIKLAIMKRLRNASVSNI